MFEDISDFIDFHFGVQYWAPLALRLAQAFMSCLKFGLLVDKHRFVKSQCDLLEAEQTLLKMVYYS